MSDEDAVNPADERLAQIARSIDDGDHTRVDPPAGLWEAIALEADLSDSALDVPAVVDLNTVRAPSPGGFGRWKGAALAAAAALLLVVGVVSMARGRPQSVEVASAEILNEGLEIPFADSGSASVVEDDGRLVLDVDLPTLPATDGFYEVWLIDSEVDGMVSLGTPDADGRFAIPSSVDPSDFPVVDVSAEPVDGDPTHSGRSILRGVLDYR